MRRMLIYLMQLVSLLVLVMPQLVRGAELVLPGAANVAGLYGSEWTTDLRVFNPSDETAVVEVTFIPYGEDGAAVRAQRVTLTVGGHGSLALDDVVAGFGQQMAGWIEIRSDVGVVGGQRTATMATEGGTFGQFIAAQVPVPERRYLSGMRGGLFRTNIGVVNWSSEPNDLAVDVADGRHLNLAGSSGVQLDLASDWVGFDPTGESGSVVAEDPFLTYASVIDNDTGDPMYVPGLEAHAQSMVAGLAHTSGTNGTTWRSDLYLHAPAALTVIGTLVLYGEDGTTVEPQLKEDLEAGETKVIADVVDVLAPGRDGAAVLWLSTVSAPVVAVARTYTDGAGGGSYGQTLIAVARDQQVTAGSDGVFLMATRDATGSTGFRSNLALVNRATSFAGYEVELRDAQGAVIGGSALTVPPRSAVQQNDVVQWLGVQSVDDGVIVVRGVSPFTGYLSLVDNQTGDACTVLPVDVPALVAR